MRTSAVARAALAMSCVWVGTSGCGPDVRSDTTVDEGTASAKAPSAEGRGTVGSANGEAPSPTSGDDIDGEGQHHATPTNTIGAEAAWAESARAAPSAIAVRWPLDEVDLLRSFGWSIDPVRHVDESHDDVLLRARDGTFVLSPVAGEVVHVTHAGETNPTAGSSSASSSDDATTITLRRGSLEIELSGRLSSLVSPGMFVEPRTALGVTRGTGPLRMRTTAEGVAIDPLQIVGTLEADLPAVLASATTAHRPRADAADATAPKPGRGEPTHSPTPEASSSPSGG